jgi:ABC-type nitrate/sulfonate/bicarbonate transport system substrate-binding protein
MLPAQKKRLSEDTMPLRGLILAAAAALLATAGSSFAQTPTPLTVMVFQGMQNLPLFAAQSQGLFAKRGLAVDLKIAPNSDEARDGLAANRHQIVHAGVDNAVAMAEVAKIDVAIVMGGDNGFNRLIVQPDVKNYADLYGKTLIVDAVDTAYAFVMYEMLRQYGLDKGDYKVKPVGASFRRLEVMLQDKTAAAAILNPPFTLRAIDAGLSDFGPAVKALGPYQATGAFLLRPWAKANADTVVRYIQAYVDGLRWSFDPKNKDAAVKLLAEGLKLPEGVAQRAYVIAAHPTDGLSKDAKLDLEGFKNVLRLRASLHGDWGGKAPPPETYLDLSYYDKALAGL